MRSTQFRIPQNIIQTLHNAGQSPQVCPCPCCMSMLHVHGACPWCMSMFTSMVHAWPCPWCMSCAWCLSMCMVPVHVHGACPCPWCMSVPIVHVCAHGACLCPWCMSVPMVHVHFMLQAHFHAADPCCRSISMLHRTAQTGITRKGCQDRTARIRRPGQDRSISMMQVHFHAACPCECCMFTSMLHVQAHAACPWPYQCWMSVSCCMSHLHA
jgi:hypothetical protein